jgi:hypothetical protein
MPDGVEYLTSLDGAGDIVVVAGPVEREQQL